MAHATFLHNRFSAGSTIAPSQHSLFAPRVAPPSAAWNVTQVIENPLYIAADLHSNVGHNMLDSIFPFMPNLLRLRESLRALASSKARELNQRLPDAVHGNFTFLLYDSWSGANWHRGSKERMWVSKIAGSAAVDLPQLAASCPRGCFVRTSWVGAGHMGLCAVNERNIFGGARVHRALFKYRARIYHGFGIPPTPAPLELGALPLVLVVKTKRVVTNLQAFVSAINAAGKARARLIRWEDFTFVEQLKLMLTAAVQIVGVGSALQNSFLFPRGSVTICLGWRNEFSRRGIEYFDSHTLHSVDHVRALYYPSYSPKELDRDSKSVTLELPKALSLVDEAIQLYTQGFTTPVPEDLNANNYDRAFEKLVSQTDGMALRVRTNDYDWTGASKLERDCASVMMGANGVKVVLWGGPRGPVTSCPWSRLVPELVNEFGL